MRYSLDVTLNFRLAVKSKGMKGEWIMQTLAIKRVYEAPAQSDGIRILVDRLWPRGISKVRAQLDDWMKDIAPSPKLRIWFNHEPEKFGEFSRLYREELEGNAGVQKIREMLKTKNVTLVYAAKDPMVNHAIVLRHVIAGRKRALK